MSGKGRFHWLDKISAILSVPLTIVFVSLSSFKIIREDNSFVGVILMYSSFCLIVTSAHYRMIFAAVHILMEPLIACG